MRFGDFDLYKDLLLEKTGIYLSADKSYLLDSRLGPIAAKWGYPSIASMTVALHGIAEPGLIKDVVESIIDHDTQFIGDRETLMPLRDVVLPNLIRARKSSKRLRIWHAGCGTGQEPYSIAMFLKENVAHLGGLKPDIVATDVAAASLETARAGIYTQGEVQRGLPVHFLLRYFSQKQGSWHIKRAIRAMVAYHAANLLDPFASLGEFDLVFCRGVLPHIAFDLQPRITGNLVRQIAPGGYLFLRPDEALPGNHGTDLKPVAGCGGLYTR